MFNVEEITLVKIYCGVKPQRKQVLKNLESILPYFTETENEMKELTFGVIKKLKALDDKAFGKINLNLALDDEEYNP
ncbi:MAG: transposon-transfer assisting family protein [Thermoplasmata archaeon]